jgi:hypothetical protein
MKRLLKIKLGSCKRCPYRQIDEGDSKYVDCCHPKRNYAGDDKTNFEDCPLPKILGKKK